MKVEADDLHGIPVVPPTDFSFRTPAEVLSSMLARAATILPSGNVYAALKNVRFDVSTSLRLSVTDGDLAMFLTTTDVEVAREGFGVLSGQRLMEVASVFSPDGEVGVDVTAGVAYVRAGRASWDLRVPDGSLFPELPDVREVVFHEVDRARLALAIGMVRSTVSTESIRPQLQMVDIARGRVRACDGVRYQAMLFPEWPEGLSVQVPVGALDAVMSLLKSSTSSTVEVGEGEHFFAFHLDGEVFVMSRLVEPFPEIIETRLVEPALANDQCLRVDRRALLTAIRQARTQADPETGAVVLGMSSDSVSVRCRDKHQNTAEVEVDAEWSGKPRDAAFRHYHLTDLLRSVKVDVCEFFFGIDKRTAPSPVSMVLDDLDFVAVLSQLRVDAI